MLSVFVILAIETGVQGYLIVLTCSSLLTYAIEHFFIGLFAICTSSLVTCLFTSLEEKQCDLVS